MPDLGLFLGGVEHSCRFMFVGVILHFPSVSRRSDSYIGDYPRVGPPPNRNISHFLDISVQKPAYSAPLTLRFSQTVRKRDYSHRSDINDRNVTV